jgi:hypothetical protein
MVGHHIAPAQTQVAGREDSTMMAHLSFLQVQVLVLILVLLQVQMMLNLCFRTVDGISVLLEYTVQERILADHLHASSWSDDLCESYDDGGHLKDPEERLEAAVQRYLHPES